MRDKCESWLCSLDQRRDCWVRLSCGQSDSIDHNPSYYINYRHHHHHQNASGESTSGFSSRCNFEDRTLREPPRQSTVEVKRRAFKGEGRGSIIESAVYVLFNPPVHRALTTVHCTPLVATQRSSRPCPIARLDIIESVPVGSRRLAVRVSRKGLESSGPGEKPAECLVVLKRAHINVEVADLGTIAVPSAPRPIAREVKAGGPRFFIVEIG